MLLFSQEVMDPQTKIEFKRMNDGSILLKVPGEINYFGKAEFMQCEGELNLSNFTKKEVVEAFERVELFFTKKPSKIITALNGM